MSNLNLNYKAIIKILGVIILIEGIAMTIPWIFAAAAHDTDTAHAFAMCAPALIVIGGASCIIIKQGKVRLRTREGYIVVAACWMLASFIGAFPYFFADFTDSFVDALFESTSGFTTTGCTSVSDALLSQGLMLWKAISHWLGGMGILVFIISILPALGINGQLIVRAEAPGPVLEKVTVRMSDSAKILYLTYISFTIIEFLLLALSKKMPVFDAVITTLGSISTGGLIAHPEGIAFYDSVYIEIVISVFCILASLNFVLYHYLVTGKKAYFFKDVELKTYIYIIIGAILICTVGYSAAEHCSLLSALRESFFQVISMATTSGYTRTAYFAWPTVCQLTLILLMFIGGCAASTSGSVKVVRVLVMLKLIWRGGIKRIHPRSVVAIKLGKNAVSAPVVSSITMFILTYMLTFLLSSFILSFQGLDLESSITTALAMLSNTGATFGEPAIAGNFSAFNPALKLYLSALMIVGRLELFPIIVLFTRNFWGRDR